MSSILLIFKLRTSSGILVAIYFDEFFPTLSIIFCFLWQSRISPVGSFFSVPPLISKIVCVIATLLDEFWNPHFQMGLTKFSNLRFLQWWDSPKFYEQYFINIQVENKFRDTRSNLF
jgi:hypothetical protein